MDFKPFQERCERLPDNDKRWAGVFCSCIEDTFGDSDAQLHSMSKACKLFYGRGSGLSKAQFFRKKKLVIEFYKWLLEEGKIDEEFFDQITSLHLEDVISTDELEHYYFKNLDSAIGFVSVVCQGEHLPEDIGALNIKSLLILAWNGVELSEIVDIKKKDIDREKCIVNIGGKQQREIVLEEKHINILIKYADTERHPGFSSGKLQDYYPSTYLFRSAQSPHFQPNNLNCCLKRFNNVAKLYGHAIGLSQIKKNGLFCKLLDCGEDKNVTSHIKELMHCDRAMAYEYAHFYNKWKEKMIDNSGEIGDDK